MSDFCIICECEPTDNTGWFISADDRALALCPWCVRDLHHMTDLVKDVHLMITPEEFVKVFETKFGKENGY